MTFYPDYKLHVGPEGKLHGGPAIQSRISYDPHWPCVNGTPGGGASNMNGVVFHTMVGNLPGTVSVFNNRSYSASSFFGIDGPWSSGNDGDIYQFGPIGQDWEAWTQSAGNPNWYGIECADDQDPSNPLTSKMLTSFAAIFECLADYAGIPFQEVNSTGGHGLGVHYMGGQAWGGHSCPQNPDGSGPRAGQRVEILRRAKLIKFSPKGLVEAQAVPCYSGPNGGK